MPVVISGTNGVSGVDGTASNPSYEGTDSNTGIFFPAADTIAFSEGGTEAMRIDSSGNVGIGTSSPSGNFQISGANPRTRLTNTSGTTTTVLQGSDSGAAFIGTETNAPYYFVTNNTERARIDSNGNMMVGTTTPVGQFISSVSAAGNGASVTAANTTTTYGGDGIMTVRAARTTTNSSFFAIGYWNTGVSNYRFYVNDAGAIFSTSTSITAISDQSLKENIRDLETGLTQVMALKPRRFDWKSGDAQNVAGFVAQEVENVLPELVSDYVYSRDEEDNPITKKALKMGDILPTLVKAIQEQQQMIETLQAKVAALEAK
jgi:hypothetical protein